ncbi:MAG: hypothetical protein INQ03_25875 [Candidatus Heimdallarchaeota archaeon]|nr:hypothetical protein [Candidatus Heimdallarchaeota archaeon]
MTPVLVPLSYDIQSIDLNINNLQSFEITNSFLDNDMGTGYINPVTKKLFIISSTVSIYEIDTLEKVNEYTVEIRILRWTWRCGCGEMIWLMICGMY